MRRVQSQQGGGRRFAQGSNYTDYNPFNPLQAFLIQNQSSKDQVNLIANGRITYFLDRNLSKKDIIYRKMLQNQISTGVMSDDQFQNYIHTISKLRDQSELDVIKMRKDQIRTEQFVKSAKNLKQQSAINQVKMTQEEFAINNCAQITDLEELKKQVQQLVHVNKIKNFVQRIKNKKQIKYLNKALQEIKESHRTNNKPIKYLINDNKDPRALKKPLRMPITDYKVVQVKQKPLNLTDDLSINFFEFNTKPHQLVIQKHRAEQDEIQENELITNLGFKIRKTSEISLLHSHKSNNDSSKNLSNFSSLLGRQHRNQEHDKQLRQSSTEGDIQSQHNSPENVTLSPLLSLIFCYTKVFVTSFQMGSTQQGADQKPPQNQKPYSLFKINSQKLVIQPTIENQLSAMQSTSSLKQSPQGYNSVNQTNGFQFGKRANMMTSEQPKYLQKQGKGIHKMNQLLLQIDDYKNTNENKHINNQIGKFQNDYNKLSSNILDHDDQQRKDVQKSLQINVTNKKKSSKSFTK